MHILNMPNSKHEKPGDAALLERFRRGDDDAIVRDGDEARPIEGDPAQGLAGTGGAGDPRTLGTGGSD